MHSVVRGTRARARGCGMHSCRYYSSPIQSTALPVPKRDAESKCSEQRAASSGPSLVQTRLPWSST